MWPVETCFDSIFGKTIDLRVRVHELNYPLTDHDPIFAQIEEESDEATENNVHKPFSLGKFLDHYNQTHWFVTLLIIVKKLNDNTKIWKKVNRTLRIGMQPRKSWITRGFIQSCDVKNKLYNQWKAGQTNRIQIIGYIQID